jgi:hypothetical protein
LFIILFSRVVALSQTDGVSTIVETIIYVDEQLHMLWAEGGYNWDRGVLVKRVKLGVLKEHLSV